MEQIDRLDAADLDRPIDPRRERRRGPLRWLLLGALIVVAGAGGLYVWQTHRAVAPAPAPEAAAPAATPAIAPQPDVAPAVRHPIEAAAQTGTSAAPLPALADSDAALKDAVSSLITAAAFGQLVQSDNLVRRFVATVDNLPRSTLSSEMRPIKPAPGTLVTIGPDGSRQIGLDNASRYAPYVSALSAMDPRQAVALYVRNYPLFQQAYQELGYPSGYFNDRLVDAIDNLLATPVVDGAVGLVQPKVLFDYADPSLQSLSAGQKALVRMGPENAAKVKARLREVRRLIAGQHP